MAADEMIVSTGFAVISPKEIPYSFAYYTLTTDDFVAYLTNRTTGSAYPAVNVQDFENAFILRPSDQILESFHSTVEATLLLIHNLQLQNMVLKETRDLMEQ